jgi:hypothetical protein
VGDTRIGDRKRARAAAAFAAVLAEVCPDFRPLRRVPARKSELLAGTLDGAPAIAKRLARPDDALAAHPAVAMSHGDLLLRNAIRDGDRIGLVDWECAGPHLEDWDLALLWIQLAPPARAPIDATVRAGGAPRWRAFLGLVAFALAREVAFLRAFRAAPGSAAALRLSAELAAAAGALAA